ncbi:hypothetical protein [Mesorhizobium abyssinicae]|uniref:hypothetical protein n=1 Tax=Mesorhizobium abyssinicae TaxID=1209958 RepID=UPI0033958717
MPSTNPRSPPTHFIQRSSAHLSKVIGVLFDETTLAKSQDEAVETERSPILEQVVAAAGVVRRFDRPSQLIAFLELTTNRTSPVRPPFSIATAYFLGHIKRNKCLAILSHGSPSVRAGGPPISASDHDVWR